MHIRKHALHKPIVKHAGPAQQQCPGPVLRQRCADLNNTEFEDPEKRLDVVPQQDTLVRVPRRKPEDCSVKGCSATAEAGGPHGHAPHKPGICAVRAGVALDFDVASGICQYKACSCIQQQSHQGVENELDM